MPSDDVLIHADPSDLDHKLAENLSADRVAYWSVHGTPRQTEPGQNIWFVLGGMVHTVGEITALEDGRIFFDGAVRVDAECPETVPTRGFTYTEPLCPRLDSIDESEVGL